MTTVTKTKPKKKYAIPDKAVKLLRLVKKDILSKPRAYNQEAWCGTACCIAGKIAIVEAKKDGYRICKSDNSIEDSKGRRISLIEDYAAKKLGVDSFMAGRLFQAPNYFYGFNWGGFAEKYENAKNSVERAKIASRRIEHFIKTGE